MSQDTYKIDNTGGILRGCIDLVESPNDDGWYAQEYDFKRADNATRTSAKVYAKRSELVAALDSGKHKWGNWS